MLIEARSLVVGYERRALLPPVDLTVNAGEAWCILGRNGAGKTTLLRTVAGLLAPVDGEVRRRPDLRMGYVPQRADVDLLVPGRVIDLVRSGLDRGRSFLHPFLPRHGTALVEKLIDELELRGIAHHAYRALSEGQKQRVLLARGLASAPEVLVLDEPTAAMDVHNEAAVFAHLERIRDSGGVALVLITHDLERAAALATHIAFIDKDDGVAKLGAARTVLRDPQFIHRMGALIQVLSGDDDTDESAAEAR